MAVAGADWRHRPVLVTGASGLLGGWLVEALLERGARVVCLIRDEVPDSRLATSGAAARVVLCRGDVRDQATVERVLGEYEIRTVFHLAAQTIVPIANRNPVSTFESNVGGTWSVLEAARRSPLVEQVLFASSDKAYGDAPAPYDEETPLRGRTPYDVSKSAADLIAQSYAHTYGLPVVVVRCGNFYGGGDLNFNRLVPGAMRDLLLGRRPVIRSNGKLVRDYIYVEDGVAAYLAAADALAAKPELAGRAYNFSLEQPLTVLEMLDHVRRAVGVDLEPEVLDEASNEIEVQVLDAGRARRELSWEPAIGLDEGLSRTAAWYRSYLGV